MDFEQDCKAEFIDSNYKYDDSTAIQLVKNYDGFLNELDNLQNFKSDDSFSDDTVGENCSTDNNEKYYEEYLEILRQIDINTWKISNSKSSIFLVKMQNDDGSHLLKIVSLEYKYKFIRNMKDCDPEYGKLIKMTNLLSPQYLFKY